MTLFGKKVITLLSKCNYWKMSSVCLRNFTKLFSKKVITCQRNVIKFFSKKVTTLLSECNYWKCPHFVITLYLNFFVTKFKLCLLNVIEIRVHCWKWNNFIYSFLYISTIHFISLFFFIFWWDKQCLWAFVATYVD